MKRARPNTSSLLLNVMATFAICAGAASPATAGRDRAALLMDPAAETDAATAEAVGEVLRKERFETAFLSADRVADPAALNTNNYALLVIPNAGRFPTAAHDALARFLHDSGSLIVVGRNPFVAAPLIETLSPAYKTYAMKDIASLRVRSPDGREAGQSAALQPSVPMWSCYARPEGKGFGKGYKWRWIPLVKAYDKDGVERGTAAWMLLHQRPLSEGAAFEDAVARLAGTNTVARVAPGEGSVVAACAAPNADTLQRLIDMDVVGLMARRIRDGIFLTRAGSDQFAYWPGETVRFGAAVINLGSQKATVAVRFRIATAAAPDKPLFEKEAGIDVQTGCAGEATAAWSPGATDSREYVVTTTLIRDGKAIDAISHGFSMLSTEKAAADEFVTARNGDFWLKGKRWYPVGVNYWPRHAIALECEDYVYHWLTPGFYNPEEVEKDLALLQSMGANFVAIRAHHQNDRRTLPDFLRRCENHGIKAMLFAQTHEITDDPHYFQGLMMPFHFQHQESADFVRAARLADNPTLMAWDLIWEPAGWVFGGKLSSFGWKDPAPYRQRWDRDWATWVEDRYGGVANAEADWGMAAPRLDGRITSPSDKQFKEDGPWRVMVSAYRRFMDDLMSRKWNDATRALKSIDPNHLVGFRQGNLPPIDFTLTATPKHVDFFAMEGYSIKPDEAGANTAGFINRYIHFITGGKPFFWAEFGSSVWSRASMGAPETNLVLQAQIHDVIYRMALKAGANGASPWWLAGGYRVSERSDFGILNPDGSLRPSGELLKRYAPLFRGERHYPSAEETFTMDRDAHAGSHWYIASHDGAAAYGRASSQERMLKIRTPGTGTTSADTPLIAVGNTPCNDRNPPKYLNAEFNWCKIKTGSGDWIDVTDGAKIPVPEGAPVLIKASLGNLQEATWLTAASCQGKPGVIYLAASAGSGLEFKAPIERDTPWMEDASVSESTLVGGVNRDTPIALQMMAEKRARFGEILRFTLVLSRGTRGGTPAPASASHQFPSHLSHGTCAIPARGTAGPP